jgi:protein O-GlcNAc transferase
LAANLSENEAFQRALAALQAGRVRDAERLFKETLRVQPRNVGALNLLGVVLMQSGRFVEAEGYLRQALQEQGGSDATLHNYGIVLKALGRPAEALEIFGRALAINPAAFETLNTRGIVFSEVQRFDEAVADFGKATELNPRFAEAYCNKGKSLIMLGRLEEAATALDSALALKPEMAEAWFALGNVSCGLKRYDAGLAAYEKTLALEPNWAVAHSNRAAALLDMQRYSEALASCESALSLAPGFARAHSNRGGALLHLGRHRDALESCARAISLDPGGADGWLIRGNVLTELKRYDEAFAAYQKTLALKPDFAEAWLGVGKVLTDLKRYTEAIASFERALSSNPELSFAAGARLSCKLFVCDWTDLEADIAEILRITREGKQSNDPFVIVAIPSSPSDQLRCAQRYIQGQPRFPAIWRGQYYAHDRIRVAYISADFHEHPIGRLTAGLFERHDKSRFEVTGIALSSPVNSPLNDRIKASFERFVDVEHKNDQEIAELIRGLEIDIVVDLMGFTRNNRLNVLARRPAPIQVNYLGFVGTMGTEFVDYVIGDKVALPFAQQPYFTEKIVHLPDCFLPADDRMEVAPAAISREEAGLPPEGFVFCSFNNSYKLSRPMFELWMRLLHAVEGSVLWLAEANPDMAANLRREVERCGIDQSRVVFDQSRAELAPHVWFTRNLARQRLAGLFLDTTPYNAGATAVVALWSGVPLLTVMGETFVGRMAASMLHAVGLPELVAHNLADYESLAVKLAREPALLSAVQRKLQDNLRSTPLFDTDRFRRHIERAYMTMIDIHRRGERPHGFSV